MQWQAKWICAELHATDANVYIYARKELDLPAITSAAARICCSGVYKLYVNGRYIGRGPEKCNADSLSFDVYDLRHILRTGRNAIAAICCHKKSHALLHNGFLFQAEITSNGDKILVISDDSWKVTPALDWDVSSPMISGEIGCQEIYDSKLKPVGWNVVGFDDSKWEKPIIVEDDVAEINKNLMPRQIPLLNEWEQRPRKIVKYGTISAVNGNSCDIAARMQSEEKIDNAGGVRYIKGILDAFGDAVEISCGEDVYITLDFGRRVVGFPCVRIKDGGRGVIDIGYSDTLDENGNVDPFDRGVPCADRLILHGGRQEWQTFQRRVFRYIQITFRELEAPVYLDNICTVRIGYPVEQVSSFECSDSGLSDAWNAGVYSLGLCMQDSFEDDPFYADSYNIENARVQALANYYCFFDKLLPAKTLREYAGGMRSGIASLEWVLMLHDYYLYTGDKTPAAELYPNVKQLLRDVFMPSHIHCKALRAAAKLASAIGEIDDAIDMHDKAESVIKEISSVDISGDNIYNDVFAVLYGPTDPDYADKVKEKIRHYLDEKSTGWAGSLNSGFYLMQALTKLGLETELFDLMKKSASIAASYHLSAEVLGIKPSMPESSVVVVQPRVGDLKWAKGKVVTYDSFVEVEWHAEPGAFNIEINAPKGFIAALPISGFNNPVIDEIDKTPETPERRARKTYGWQTAIWKNGIELDPYIEWLHSQEEKPPDTYNHKHRCSEADGYVWIRECESTNVRYEIREGA